MNTMTRYGTVTLYVKERTELEVARIARRPSLVPADEVARLAEAAFGSGIDADETQSVVDQMVEHAVEHAVAEHFDEKPSGTDAEHTERRSIETAVNQLAEKTLGAPLAAALKNYCSAHAQRSAKVEWLAAKEAAEKRAVGAVYAGVWEQGPTYYRGAMTTDHGTLWHCEAESTTARPGSSSDWRLMVKNQRAGR